MNLLQNNLFCGVFYPYGYNGMESDDEVKGEGNSYTTEFRQNDPRLGRWLSYDPKPEAGVSPYCSMDNNPIRFNDILGLYTKKRAERLAEKGKNNGYDAHIYESAKKGGGWGVSYTKKVGKDTYGRCQTRGKFLSYERGGFRKFSTSAGEVQHLGIVADNALSVYDISIAGLSAIADWFKSKDFVLQVGGKVNVGLQAGFTLKEGPVQLDVKGNLLSLDLVSGGVDLTELGSGKDDYYFGNYVGKDSKFYFSQGIQAELSGFGLTLGGHAKRQFYTYSNLEGGYGDSYDYGLYIFKPIFKKATGSFLEKNGLKPLTNSGSGTISSPKAKVAPNSNFTGMDFSFGAALILGVQVDFKVGYYDK